MRQKQINTNSNSIRINYPSTDYFLLNKKIREYIDFQTNNFKNLTLDKVKTNYYLIIDYKEYGYKNIISYVFLLETYNGGAHPDHLIWTINYDKKINKIITIKDLINSDPMILEKLSSFSYNVLSNDNAFKNSNILSMLKDGTAPTIDNFKNIVFSNNGLIIYFERYQIAPYYFGEIALTYPMQQG